MIKRFLLKMLLFCTLPMLLMYCLQHYVDAGLRNATTYPFADWNELFTGKVSANFLILGSSRAGHFSTNVLDTALKKKGFNMAMVGYGFDMQYCRLQCFLKYNKKPECILQSLDLFTLEGPKNLYNARQFLPYLNEEYVQKATVRYQGAFPFYYFYFPLIKYRDDEDLMPLGIELYNQKRNVKEAAYNGYKCSDKSWDGSFDRWKTKYSKGYVQQISEGTCKAFDGYLAYCKKSNIKVVLIYSPELAEAQLYMRNRNEIVGYYKAFAKKYELHFLDYGSHAICRNGAYFFNGTHLNKKGADLFSALLAQDLKKIKD